MFDTNLFRALFSNSWGYANAISSGYYFTLFYIPGIMPITFGIIGAILGIAKWNKFEKGTCLEKRIEKLESKRDNKMIARRIKRKKLKLARWEARQTRPS